MKRLLYLLCIAAGLLLAQSCHPNPHNTFGGPSDQPQDTAASRRDTSGTGMRTDR